MIDSSLIPRVEVIECMAGHQQELCKTLGHNLHELMPPRVKIVASVGNDSSVYAYTSPIKKDWLVRKLMKFTVPISVLEYRGDTLVEDL